MIPSPPPVARHRLNAPATASKGIGRRAAAGPEQTLSLLYTYTRHRRSRVARPHGRGSAPGPQFGRQSAAPCRARPKTAAQHAFPAVLAAFPAAVGRRVSPQLQAELPEPAPPPTPLARRCRSAGRRAAEQRTCGPIHQATPGRRTVLFCARDSVMHAPRPRSPVVLVRMPRPLFVPSVLGRRPPRRSPIGAVDWGSLSSRSRNALTRGSPARDDACGGRVAAPGQPPHGRRGQTVFLCGRRRVVDEHRDAAVATTRLRPVGDRLEHLKLAGLPLHACPRTASERRGKPTR